MICQILLSPQVKRWAIITYKHGMYELRHKLPNHLRLRTFDPFPRHFHRREKKKKKVLEPWEITKQQENVGTP